MQVCNKARELIQNENRKQIGDLFTLLSRCESPVEQILLAALWDRWHAEVYPQSNRLQAYLAANYPAWDGVFLVCCEPQKTITTWSDQRYRVDFYIYLTRFRHHIRRPAPADESWPELGKLVVEVDGHEFHDRTKQQASSDRTRDRQLTLDGYRVVRFTGSDVYNDPEQCAEDIDFHINDIASNVFDDYFKTGRLEELIAG